MGVILKAPLMGAVLKAPLMGALLSKITKFSIFYKYIKTSRITNGDSTLFISKL